MDQGMSYMYNNPNMKPSMGLTNDLRDLNRRLDNLERRIFRLEKKLTNMPFRDEKINNYDYPIYPPAQDNYML